MPIAVRRAYREDRDPNVDVVVDLDPRLRLSWSQDSPDVLNDTPLELDREHEEERVERRAVEPFTEQTRRRHEDEPSFWRDLIELLHDHATGPLAELAVKPQRLEPAGRKALGDRVEMLGPSCEYQAVAPSARCRSDVVANGYGAGPVLDHAAERLLYVLAIVVRLMVCLMHDQVEGSKRRAFVEAHGVADGSAIHRHQYLETVPPVRRRGESEPMAHRYLAHDSFECHRRDMVAFVDDHEAVASCEVGDVVVTGEALDHREVDHAGRPFTSTTDLANLLRVEIEVRQHSIPPLFDERLPVHNHESGRSAPSQDGTTDHGLP